MTQPTHDEVIAWIDKQKGFRCVTSDEYADYPCNKCVNCASYNANRDVLERHKPKVYYLCPHDQWNGLEYETLETATEATLAYEATATKPVESQVNRITRIEICEGCTEILREREPAYHHKSFPCPTYLDILQRIAEVM